MTKFSKGVDYEAISLLEFAKAVVGQKVKQSFPYKTGEFEQFLMQFSNGYLMSLVANKDNVIVMRLLKPRVNGEEPPKGAPLAS